ncbi:MAG: heavy metal translocating P-type ATPase [Bacillales bacterium]
MKQKFSVEGIKCAGCVEKIRKKILGLDGVNECNINLVNKIMIVNYDESKLTKDDINNEVKNIGFSSCLFQNKDVIKKQEEQEKKLQKEKNKIKLTLLFLIALIITSLLHLLIFKLKIININLNPLILIAFEIFFLLPILIINNSYFKNGYRSLFKLSPNMDSLIALGSSASFIYALYGLIMILILSSQNKDYSFFLERMYFESSGMIIAFVSLGKFLENKASKKTGEVVAKLMALQPEFINIIQDDKEINIDIVDLKINDLVIIRPGELIPSDGVIINGEASVDESMITGESKLIKKSINDKVIAGTINKKGSFTYKSNTIGEDTTLNKLIKLVDEASSSKAKIATLADKIASIFTPSIMVISFITFVIWLLISNFDFSKAFNFSISVLVISCPCALGLATPVAIIAGMGMGAKNNILIKSASALENLSKVKTIFLDKTGTITEGKMNVTNFIGKNEYLKEIASIENLSNHPIAEAIVQYYLENNNKNTLIEQNNIINFNNIEGYGIEATINDNHFVIGNLKLLNNLNIILSDKEKEQYNTLLNLKETIVFVCKNNNVINIISIGDKIKEDSYNAIKYMQKLNLNIVLLSGDNESVCKEVSNKLNIKEYYYNVNPKEKLEIIKKHQEKQSVAMIGDGINDAPSLKISDVGIAIGAGSDIAIESGDIILTRSNLLDAYKAIKLSKKVVRTIKTNLFWAFFYNIIMVPLAAGCLYFSPLYIELNPMIASLAMSLSSLTVVTNALRLKRIKL